MQTSRQWMVTHEWMVKPMPQREWIERKGMLVWIAEVFTSLGAGLYLVSLCTGSWVGMLVAWAIIMFLKLPVHLAYFGHPLRFWRTLPPFSSAWKTSWFTRGILFSIFFGTFGAIQLGVTYFTQTWPLIPFPQMDILFKILAGIFALLTGIYGGFIMSYCKSVPFWNTGLLPIVFIVAGIADGLALTMGIGMSTGDLNLAAVEYASRILLIANALLIFTYLLNASYQSYVAKLSAKELLVGRVAVAFWFGIVLLGIIIPISISVSSIFVGEISGMLMIIAIACHTLGAFALKYCLLKVGIHRPLITVSGTY